MDPWTGSLWAVRQRPRRTMPRWETVHARLPGWGGGQYGFLCVCGGGSECVRVVWEGWEKCPGSPFSGGRRIGHTPVGLPVPFLVAGDVVAPEACAPKRKRQTPAEVDWFLSTHSIPLVHKAKAKGYLSPSRTVTGHRPPCSTTQPTPHPHWMAVSGPH